jgi:anti-sigma regulatory factor (Ser/Thr protein kinase)
MNAILGFSHLALAGAPPSGLRDYLEKIEAATHSLGGIINAILDYSKLDSGQMTLQAAPFRLDKLFENMAAQFADRASEAGLGFRIATVPASARTVVGDGLRLEQLLNNLIDNALKFTETGQVSVGCESLSEIDGRIRLRFCVADTGVGMTTTQMETLFQPFRQGDGSTTRRHGGTGLGLAICRRLADMMMGELSFVSEPLRGTTVRFVLELPVADEEEMSVEPVAQPVSQMSQSDGTGCWPDDLAALLADLRSLVAENDTEAQPASRALAERLANTSLARASAQLSDLLAGYDFPAALEVLDRMIFIGETDGARDGLEELQQ